MAPDLDPVVVDDREVDAGANAGEPVYSGIGVDQPEHPAPPVPTWHEVALEPVEDAAPPVFLVDTVPTEVPPVDGGPAGPGQLVGNQPGCLSDCIVHALLTPGQFQSDVTFDIETTVATQTFVWVMDEQPALDGGYPVVGGWPTAWNPSETHTWETILDLDFAETYWIIIRVDDQYGNEKWAMTEYTTIDAPTPDQLHANGDGCYFQCIEFGTVERTDSYDRVVLVIGTDIPAHEDVDFDVAVSTSEPGTIGGKPFLPHDHPFVVDQDGGNDVRGHVSGLAADTVYHVVVKVTDEDGFTAHAVGEFRTDPLPPPPPPTDVRVTWERMHVTHDGDVGASGKGEIRPSWGIPGQTLGWFHRDKIDQGESVALNGHTWVSVAEGEALPRLVFNISESDFWGADSHDCTTAMATTYAEQQYHEHCIDRINVALLVDVTVDWIEALPTCQGYGLPADKVDDHCIVLHTWEAHDNYAQADVLMSFRIAD